MLSLLVALPICQGAVTLLAGVELGGTKCVCISGTGPDDIRAMVELPTTTPDETLAAIRAVLGQWDHEALGIASFGPLDLAPSSPRYERIVHPPKPGWNPAFLPAMDGGQPFATHTEAKGDTHAAGLGALRPGLGGGRYGTH